jgi:hypothetical protein
MIIEDEIIGSQSDDDQQSDTEMDEIMSEFGYEKEEVKKEDPVKDEAPAKEDIKTGFEKVKHNKGEEDVDISTKEKLHDHLQRSLALDKERDRKTELEKHLDRAAKLAGYKDHSAYVADFDNIEKQQQQKEQDEHNQLLIDLREQAEDAGLDPDKVEAFMRNHPLVKEAEKLKQEKATDDANKQSQDVQQANINKWQTMYKDPRVLLAFPDIVKDSEAFEKGEIPAFFTPDMQSKINRGYDPLDAMILSHADKIQSISKKKTEQQIIKEQQLGMRSRVETNHAPDNEKQVPAALASAFAAFGLPAESAKKYVK